MVGLVSTGFALVALVLLVAIIFAIFSVDSLRTQSEQIVLKGIQLTNLSRELRNSITAMERNARQYMVVGEPTLLESYEKHEREFQQTLKTIESFDADILPEEQYAEMRGAHKTIHETISSYSIQRDEPPTEDLEPFQTLQQKSRIISTQSNIYIEDQLKNLQEYSLDVRTFLLLTNATLIPAALFLIILFTALITRPVREIKNAIKRLGEGDFDKPVSINGPAFEMQSLAEQLDWLRCRIVELETEKKRFLQHMSHELKTPLASLREGTDLLVDETAGNLSIQQREIVDILYESSLELQALVENLFNFTAWQKWSTDIKLNHFDLSELINNVINRHRLGIANKELRIISPQQPLDIVADRQRLKAILDNLIANAIKFTAQNGTITISAELQDDEINIIVKDDGPGIPSSEREHVFTPFYQGDNKQDTTVRGTGIGLSVVRESVRAHDGEVRIYDNEPSGACFHITIPQNKGNI